MTTHRIRNAALLLLALPGLAMGADTIYKYVDENGKVTYSNTPLKGGRKVDLPPVSTVSLPKATPKQDTKPAADADLAQRKKQLQEAIAQQEKAVEAARSRAKEGDTPEYTRTTKTVTGKDGKPTTLTEIRDNPEAYQEKMKKLKDDVTAQEQKLAELKSELNRLDSKP